MKRRRGFTLIELLVVVAIIALLMAILLPSLARAKEQARITACASNHKQIMIALNMYNSENAQKMPISYVETHALYIWGANIVDPNQATRTIATNYTGYANIGLLWPYLPGCIDDGTGGLFFLHDGVPFSRRKAVSCTDPEDGARNAVEVPGWANGGWASVEYMGWYQKSVFTTRGYVGDASIAMSIDWLRRNVQNVPPPHMYSHGDRGGNVGYLDGHVRFVKNEELLSRYLNTNLPDDVGDNSYVAGTDDPYGRIYRRILNNP